jgi:orotate phosphoribosyltransferase-like protein
MEVHMDEIQTEVSNKPAALLEGFMSEEQFADELEVSVQTARRWQREGRGPQRAKIGKKVLYSRDAVLAWIRGLAGADEVAVKRARAGLKSARKSSQ